MLAFGLRPPEASAPTLDILIQPKIDFGEAWQRRIEKSLAIIMSNSLTSMTRSLSSPTPGVSDQSDIAALERLKQLGGT